MHCHCCLQQCFTIHFILGNIKQNLEKAVKCFSCSINDITTIQLVNFSFSKNSKGFLAKQIQMTKLNDEISHLEWQH